MGNTAIEPAPVPLPHTSKKPWYRRRSVLMFAFGVIFAFLLVLAFNSIRDRMSSETKLACHQPTTQSTQTPYCVYYRNHRILIGANNDRGITYTIPYDLKDISVSWDNNTDAATITMPGTKLVVQSSEYVDGR